MTTNSLLIRTSYTTTDSNSFYISQPRVTDWQVTFEYRKHDFGSFAVIPRLHDAIINIILNPRILFMTNGLSLHFPNIFPIIWLLRWYRAISYWTFRVKVEMTIQSMPMHRRRDNMAAQSNNPPENNFEEFRQWKGGSDRTTASILYQHGCHRRDDWTKSTAHWT